MGRDYKKLDFDKLKNKLTSYNWGRFFALDCPVAAWNCFCFFKVISDIVDVLSPVREFRILESRPPWYTDEIISQSIEWESIHRVAKKAKIPAKMKEANGARNQLKEFINKTKKNHYLSQFEQYVNDSKKFWDNVSRLTGT